MKLPFRTGIGYDAHRFSENRKLILGGVEIPYEKGLLGHSDADVLIHSICDAMLGALSLGDIGHHFPDNDIKFKDADSRELLREVNKLINDNDYKIGNIDSVIVLEKPRLAPFIDSIRKSLAEILSVQPDCISVKATTNEQMGFAGREEGVFSITTVMLVLNK